MKFKEYYLTEANLYNKDPLIRFINSVLVFKNIVCYMGTHRVTHLTDELEPRFRKDKYIYDWFLTQYVKWFCSPEDDLNKPIKYHKWKPGEPEWAKKLGVYDFNSFGIGGRELLYHIIDYFEQLPIEDLAKIHKQTYPVIQQKVAQWDEHLRKQILLKQKALVEGEDYSVLMLFANGFKWIELLSKQAYQNEGDMMGHCVAGYWSSHSNNVWSLRDQNMKPHITMEVEDPLNGFWRVVQMQGNQNTPPKAEYQPYIDELRKRFKLQFEWDRDQ